MKFNVKLSGNPLRRRYKLSVGIPPGQPVPDHRRGNKLIKSNITMGQLANLMVYGNANIPARNFMEVAIRQNKEKWTSSAAMFIEHAINNNYDIKDVLRAMGEMVAADIKTAILSSSEYKPNSPATLAVKGGHKPPLVDEGFLLNSMKVLSVEAENG